MVFARKSTAQNFASSRPKEGADCQFLLFLLYGFWGSAAILFRLCDNSFQTQRQSFQAQPQFFYFETGWCIRKIRAVTVLSAALFYVSLL